MTSETYANDYETALNGGISAVRPVNVTVQDAIPATITGGNFRFRIDNEYLLCPAGGVAGLTLNGCTTVEGSVAAAHSTSAKVDQVLTRQGLLNSPGPMTAQGDIVYLDASLNPARLPLGSASQVLTSDAGGTGIPKWAAASGGGGGSSTPLLNPYTARMHRAAALTSPVNTWTKFPFDTVTDDVDGDVVIGSSRYVAKVAGKYQVNAAVSYNAGLGNQTILAIRVNGVEVDVGQNVNTGFGTNASGRVSLSVGDYVEAWYYSNGAALNPGSSLCYMDVSLIPGTPALPANTLAARMYRNAALTLTAGSVWTKLPFDAVDYDPDSDLTIASNRYVVRIAGKYQVNAVLNLNAYQNAGLQLAIYKNGAAVRNGLNLNSGVGGMQISADVDCAVGDYIEIFYNSAAATAVNVGLIQTYCDVAFLAGTGATIWVPQGPVIIPGFAGSPDIKAGGANDDEFEQNAAGTPSGWTAFNSPTTVDTNTAKSMLHLKHTNASTNDHRGILKAAPAIPFTVTAKLAGWRVGGVSYPDYGQVGLNVLDGSTTGKFVEISIATDNGAGRKFEISDSKYSDWATYVASAGSPYLSGQVAPIWLRTVVHAANNIDHYISYDGLTWSLFVAGVNYLVNATYVGISLRAYSQETEAFIDYIRFS